MQDLDDTMKDSHLRFGDHDLTLPWCVQDPATVRALKVRGPDLYKNSAFPDNIPDLEKDLGQIQSDGFRVINSGFYIPERNLVIIPPCKAGSSSIKTILMKLEAQKGTKVIRRLNTYEFLNLVESNDPEIWYIYRDPVMRYVSYFYQMGERQFYRFGMHWDYTTINLNRGTDPHRRPQFSYIPGYYKDIDIRGSIEDSDHAFFTSTPIEILSELNWTRVAEITSVPHDIWGYPFLENFVPHKNVKFFWLHEIESDRDLMEIIYKELDVGIGRVQINTNHRRPEVDDVPTDFKQRIWDATVSERNFLSKLTWENGPIEFYGP